MVPRVGRPARAAQQPPAEGQAGVRSLTAQYGGQQVTGALVSQLLPIAHQVILPQVLFTAMQQIRSDGLAVVGTDGSLRLA